MLCRSSRRQDYDDAALLRILRKMAKAEGVDLPFGTAVAAVGALAKSRALPNFGNAGSVSNMLSKARTDPSAGGPRADPSDSDLSIFAPMLSLLCRSTGPFRLRRTPVRESPCTDPSSSADLCATVGPVRTDP